MLSFYSWFKITNGIKALHLILFAHFLLQNKCFQVSLRILNQGLEY